MSNRAYLLVVNDRGVTWSKKPECEVIAEGINEIPIFWAALFTPADRRLDTYEGADGETKVPNWCVELKTAKQRLSNIRNTIPDLLDNRSRRLWAKWLAFIQGANGTFIKTNAAELWALDPRGYDSYCTTLLRAFSSPSLRTMKAAMECNELSYENRRVIWADAEETLCKLAGAEHIRELPWFQEEGDQADDIPDEPNEPRTMQDAIYEAISPEDSLEEAIRKARQMKKKPGSRARRK